jgi:2-polyprenyl-3-methyl-5-hydroxy-6-metoxy-1,4-benzoquinol methylase
MDVGLQPWHQKCPKCGYENAEFEMAINKKTSHKQLDENARESGLRLLRIRNFNKLLQAIVTNGRNEGSLLEVGCAHGWFLEAAKKNGFDILGIEPDLNIFNTTSQRGLPVRSGFFPEILSANEQFDLVVFNDVFEHMPDIKNVLAECREHLRPGGMLVLNLPSSSGMIYKLACLLCRLKFNVFFERLWQKGLPSPHLHYFNSKNLHQLLRNEGFEVVASGRLSTLHLKGLYTRVSFAKHSLTFRLFSYLVLAILLPISLAMPSDIIYLLSTKK